MKKPPKLVNVLLYLVVVAVIVAAAYLLTQSRQADSQANALLGGESSVDQSYSMLSSKYDSLTLVYTDPADGYSIRIPIGYEAIANPDEITSLRIAAHLIGSSSEVFSVALFEDTDFSQEELKQLTGFDQVLSQKDTSVNGRKTILFSAVNQSVVDGEQLYYKLALVQCPSYTISFTGVIPDELSPDLELYDYMLGSIKCQSE